MPVTPDYAGLQTMSPQGIASYWLALFFALAPLATGVAILVLYLLTEWTPLIDAGFTTLIAGVLSVMLSAMLIAMYRFSAGCCEADAVALVRSRTKRVVLLNLINFPVALGCVLIGGRHAAQAMTSYTVSVTNASSTSVSSIVLSGPGVRIDLGPIQAGQTVRRDMTFTGDGPLNYDANINGRHVVGVADGYVTSGMGGKHRITINGQQVVISP